MVGGTLETERECPTEKVVMSVDRHFVLELTEMKKGVGCSPVIVEGGHENRSVVISSDSGESEGLSPLCSIPFGDYWLAWLSRF